MTGDSIQARLRRLLLTPAARRLRRAAGPVETHLVGGALRDAALDRPRRDLDAVVARDGHEIARRYARLDGSRLVELGGERFAAYRLVGEEVTLDLWDRRGASLRSDLERRDLTVNSAAIDLASGRVVDPFGGLADLARRRLRATTPRSFAEDPLRVLRLARLAGALPGFSVEPATLDLARRDAGRLVGVAAERVRDEVELTLAALAAKRALEALIELGLYPALWRGEEAGADEASATRARALVGALDVLLAEAAGSSGTPAPTPDVDRLAARLTLLFEALEPAAVETARRALGRFRDRGYVTRRTADRIGKLLAARSLPGGAAASRWFLHRAGELWPTAVALAGARAAVAGEIERWRPRAAELGRLAAEAGQEIFAPAPLLDGREIGELLALPPGPELGAAVAALERRQVEGGLRSRREATEFLRRWRAAGGGARK